MIEMLKTIKHKNTRKVCSNCGAKYYSTNVSYSTKPLIYKKEIKGELTINDVISILSRIPGDQWKLLFRK